MFIPINAKLGTPRGFDCIEHVVANEQNTPEQAHMLKLSYVK